MLCPKCNGKLASETTVNTPNNETYRRKKCQICGHVIYTCEFEVEQTKRFKKEWAEYGYQQYGYAHKAKEKRNE